VPSLQQQFLQERICSQSLSWRKETAALHSLLLHATIIGSSNAPSYQRHVHMMLLKL
jgi:hypothetical protein